MYSSHSPTPHLSLSSLVHYPTSHLISFPPFHPSFLTPPPLTSHHITPSLSHHITPSLSHHINPSLSHHSINASVTRNDIQGELLGPEEAFEMLSADHQSNFRPMYGDSDVLTMASFDGFEITKQVIRSLYCTFCTAYCIALFCTVLHSILLNSTPLCYPSFTQLHTTVVQSLHFSTNLDLLYLDVEKVDV